MAEQLTHNNVSTRRVLGGHSFSSEDVERMLSACGDSEVVVAAAKTALVPYEEFQRVGLDAAVAALGLHVSVGESALSSAPHDGMVAVMVLREALCDVMRRHATKCGYTSPLLLDSRMERGAVLSLADGLLFVRIYDDGLQFADVVEVQGEADIHYYLEQINRVYNIYNIGVCLQLGAEQLMKVSKTLFKQIVCE